MEAALRTAGRPLVSFGIGHTSGHVLTWWVFSLQYELSYTNVLTMLGIGWNCTPGGGPENVSNRWLLEADQMHSTLSQRRVFFDAFVLGDGEEVVLEIAEVVDQWKTQGSARLDVLKSPL